MSLDNITFKSLYNIKSNQLSSSYRTSILELAKELPEWFTEAGIKEISIDLNNQNCFMALKDSQLVGFITYFTNQGCGHIGWLAVSKKHQGKGVGNSLLQKIVMALQNEEIKELFVSTLGDSVDYLPYEQTRNFYRKQGFETYEIRKHDNNPEMEEELILKLQI